MTAWRTGSGGTIDRSRSVRFTFDGQSYTGHPGDTLASALLAAGVRLFGRSFKYHRPRGPISAGVDEPNALVTILRGPVGQQGQQVREPNVPATTIEIFDGLTAVSQNRFPSLSFDVSAVNQLGGKLIGAGFYYKTFMGPVIGPLKGTRFWMFCEHFIRRAAGLGRAGRVPDASRYERMNAFCDVLVVGSGPAGLSAARTAAESGAKVILAELDPTFGGSAAWSGVTVEGRDARAWAEAQVEDLQAMENVTLLPRTTVWGYYDGNTMAAIERVADHKATAQPGEPRHRGWTIRAGRVVIATGALERPLVFPGNDRPGVMLASAAQRYAGQFGVVPGKRIAVFANNDSAYAAAAALREAGADIATIVDVRSDIPAAARSAAAAAGAELLPGHAVVATEGWHGLSAIKVQPWDAAARQPRGDVRSISVDCLLVSGGWSPVLHLASQAGGKPAWDDRLQAFLPPPATQNWRIAGAANGAFSTAAAVAQGEAAGLP
ncbi:MAG: (2Fe-2S)-binding protein, partial [Rhizobiales bacterium]|nr:(2Fe-2S)-binding protein [Hyphomicrobiales bacterium]